ncbi:MAG: hypothetical protein NVV73_05380 [Cellvibrionaceae bacterium]|nr:hypothetical protein [Cellvibrionaceae bacterium]
MKLTDSNTESQFFAVSKALNNQWKANLSYLSTEGGQSPALELRTTYSDPGDTIPVRHKERFSLGDIVFVSPAMGGSTLLGANYDLSLTVAELERTFSGSSPFSVGLAFGILLMDMDISIHELGQDNTQVMSYSKLHPKAGIDLRYALHSKLSISAYAGRSYDMDEVSTFQYGLVLALSPVDWLELSARAYTFRSNFDSDESSLDIHHNGTALGVKLNF